MWTFPDQLDLEEGEEHDVEGDADDDSDGEAGSEEGDEADTENNEDGKEEDQDQEMEDAEEPDEGYQLRGNRKTRTAQEKQAKNSGAVVAGSKAATSADRVHCAAQVEYWRGMIELIRGYWMGFKVSVWLVWIGKWQYAVCLAYIHSFHSCTNGAEAGAMHYLHQGGTSVHYLFRSRPYMCWVHQGEAFMFFCTEVWQRYLARQDPLQPGNWKVLSS